MFVVGLTRVLGRGGEGEGSLRLEPALQFQLYVELFIAVIEGDHTRCLNLQECESPSGSIAFTVASADVTSATDGVCR